MTKPSNKNFIHHNNMKLSTIIMAFLAFSCITTPSFAQATKNAAKYEKVKAGETSNGGGHLEVANDTTSSGIGKIEKVDNERESQRAETRTGFVGEVNNMRRGDEVDLGSSNTVTVTGTGGTVTIKGGSSITIVNEADYDTPGSSITVKLSNGDEIIVEPGSRITVDGTD